MNKIYKVMYSKVKQCCVVVSEIAKSHGRHTKRSVAKSSAALTAGVLIALGSFSFVGMPVAQAADGTESMKNNDYVGANGYYWYLDEKTNQWKKYPYKISSLNNNRSWQELPNYEGGGAKEPGAVTAGLYAQAGEQTVTIGNRNAGQSKGSVFIGELDGYNNGGKNDPVGMRNNYVTAVGFQSNATGWGSIAIGSNAVAENTQETSQVVDYEGNAGTSGTVQDDNYGIKLKPSITWSSVALGYSAKAKDGNIAIGANSDATSTDKGDSYVSVGNGTLKRRITNVAKGIDNSAVVTVGQMNDAIAQTGGSVKAGWGITKSNDNTISVKHNLSTGDSAYAAVAYADSEATGLILGGSIQDRNADEKYGATTETSVIVGARNALASNDNTVVIGGDNNIASRRGSTVVGGSSNTASGQGYSEAASVFGGSFNISNGLASVVLGGVGNVANNEYSTNSGGAKNVVFGLGSNNSGGLKNVVYASDNASSFGGVAAAVNGQYSTGVAGGSTGSNARLSFAAGFQSLVTDSGVRKTVITRDEYERKWSEQTREFGPVQAGFNPITNKYEQDDKISTALGYQATADEPGTIAFGHDAGDESGYTYEWETLTDEKGNPKQNEIDGTTNDYTKAPKSVKKKAPYTSAYYNRLVKAADGIEDHDAVVMEQLKNASGVGSKIKIYQTDENGNIKFDENNNPIEDTSDSDAVKTKRETAREASKDAWGQALGAGTFTTGTPDKATDASTSDQLITGKTLYDYDKPTASQNYVNVNNTTGQNLSALDAQVKANADALDKPNHNIKYYSVKTAPLTVDGYTNEKNDGAQGKGSIAAGFVTHADGIASTVTGSYSGVINSGTAQGLDLRGAAALSYGTVNVNQNTDSTKAYSGVANSIVGQANMTTNSNAAIIYGAGNTVTDSYRPIDEKKAADILGSTSDPKALSKAMQDAVKDSGGQVMVMGGGNSVDKAYMTQVVGVGNKVTGQDSTYAEKTSTQYNFVDGFQNELKNGKNDYIIGTKNKVSGDSVDKNQSNIIFGDNHTLTNTKNAVIIGSSDKVTEIAGSDAVSIGYNANAGGESVALGSNAVAGGNALAVGPYANAKNNSIALGIHASATSSQNLAIGYYANVTGRPDTIKNSVALGASSTVGEKDILSTDNGFGVLSIGAKDKERRIIHVRAGVNDTDAVNVSQLKSVQSGLTDKGLTFVTNDGEHIAKLGSKVTIQGTAKKADHEYTADNLTTEIDKDGNITILMDKDMSVEKLAVNGKPGTPGSIGVKGQDGQSGVGIDGKDGISIKGRDGKDGVTIKAVDGKDGTEGHIGLTGPAGTNGKDGTNAVDITVKNGYNTEAKDGKDGINGEKGVDGTSLTRVVYEDKNGEHQIATLEDGLKFKGDNGKEISKKLNNTLEIIGGAKGDLTEGNIGVNSTTDGKLKVQLAKDLTGLNSATYTTTTGEGESAKTSTTVVNANGLTINGGPSITNNGIDGGKKTITNVGSGIKAGTDGKYTVTDANNSNAANIGDVNNMVKQAVGELSDATKTNLAGKANVDASNLTAGDVTKWQDKLGNGKVESGNTGLVTGDTVFNAVDTKANRDGSNLTDKEADSFSEKIAKGEVKPGENRAVSGDAVSQAISKVTGDMNTKLDGKANTSLDNITKDGQTVIKKLSQDAVQVKGGTAITVDDNVDDKGNKTYMISANNNGKVEKDDGNLISGDTLYKEVHVDKDGTYIKSKDSATGKDMTVAQNLSALDTGLKTTSDLIHMNDKGDIQIGGSSKATKIDVSGKDSYGKTTGRVITGVVTDAQDASSAANVGYVNGVTAANTQQIYRDMNSAYGRLNNNINKAAAGSNALAALHPLDYDPDDKADFAVGYGHYRNANAAAVGAFYHPNENTMVNVGVSLGNGDPGFNAGVSFKVGRGSAGREAMSRTEMAKVINSQSKEIDALKKDNADKDKRIDALEQKMAEILAKLDKNGK